MTRRPALLLASIAVLLAACAPEPGGPSPTIGTTTTGEVPGPTSTTIPGPDAAESFRLCLADRGIDIDPLPSTGGDRPRLDLVTRDLDFTDPNVAEAVTECTVHLETGALYLGDDDSLREVVLARLRSFSGCVRERGVADFPDPIPGFEGVGVPYPVADIPYSDPALAPALEACRASVLSDLPGLIEDS